MRYEVTYAYASDYDSIVRWDRVVVEQDHPDEASKQVRQDFRVKVLGIFNVQRYVEKPPEPKPPVCVECGGEGKVLDAPNHVLDGRVYWITCPTCHGKKQ